MTPFPEVELVTLDRLEVAIKNKNYKLLKEGAYKLHEKYHSGYKFEYLDKLKAIYLTVSNDRMIPDDIKDILCPTIKDILFEAGNAENTEESPNRVSGLTQLSYNVSNQNNSVATVEKTTADNNKTSAFDVFGADNTESNTSSNLDSPFKQDDEPFQEFHMPKPQIQNNINLNNSVDNQDYPSAKGVSNPEIARQEPLFKNDFSYPKFDENTTQAQPFENYQTVFENNTPKVTDNVSIFYCQEVSTEKIKNILRYRELISKIRDEQHSINEILNLISEINVQSNTNISELKNILDQLQINQNKTNLITNSTSAHLIGLMEKGNYSYSLYDAKEEKQFTLVPVFGLSNQFVCPSCGETYLDKEDKINPLVLQCPKCKNPMFPSFYTANNQDIFLNIDYYNNALVSLSKSDVWVIIHPILEDKVMTNLIMSALKLNSSLKQIYILDKDINLREEFKKRFIRIKSDVRVNVDVNALEDFLNSIGK